MIRPRRIWRAALALLSLLASFAARNGRAQAAPAVRGSERAIASPESTSAGARRPAADSATLRASDRYRAGTLHRFLLGDNYRDLWATTITVPRLDLAAFAGGLHAAKTGGGAQTRSLHLDAANGTEYVFRPVHKALLMSLSGFEGTLIESALVDGLSASYPVAPLLAPAFLAAAGVLHVTPRLVVMPDAASLGEFRREFAGVLGLIEEVPRVPDDAPAFANAVRIIDSEELLKLIDADPAERIDARALLRARLVDLLLNDNDRHPDQWKWARLTSSAGSPWVPIPRDRDKVLVSYEGLLLRLVRLGRPELVTFTSTYPHLSGLFQNAIEFDRRLLGGLDRPTWDSVAVNLTRAITDSVIDAAFRSLPSGYRSSEASLVASIRARRDDLPAAADHYYRTLFAVLEIHATDAPERATITRSADGGVTIVLQSGGQAPHYVRRVDPRSVAEIRLYLHGGDDTAMVNGSAQSSLPVRIMGGNGRNVITDSSTVGGRMNVARLYDVGRTESVRYPPSDGGKSHKSFSRRPLLQEYRGLMPAQRDFGSELRPIAGLKVGHDLGIVPQLGVSRTTFAFRTTPYKSRVDASVAYSTAVKGVDLSINTDHRFESSALHVITESRMTQLQVGRFLGSGNDVPFGPEAYYDVRQTQWTLHPAIGLSLGERSELSLGPILKYTSSDSVSGQLLSETRPYGFSRFGQAGVQLKFRHESVPGLARAADTSAKGGTVRAHDAFLHSIEIAGSAYPAMLDADRAFAKMSVVGVAHVPVPAVSGPILALRAGVEKVWGEYPYFEAAFLGGSHSLRTSVRQRFAGDAAVYGSAELRVPVARFAFLLPVNVGLLGFVDAGRVFVDGQSPGGWHTGAGAGFWLGVLSPGTSITIMRTNSRERRMLFGLGFDY